MQVRTSLPDASTATPIGLYSVALVAGTLSPLKPNVPVPAIVEIILDDTSILRTR